MTALSIIGLTIVIVVIGVRLVDAIEGLHDIDTLNIIIKNATMTKGEGK